MTTSSPVPRMGSRMEEPPMYLQRPSSGRAQSIGHVLARTFRNVLGKDMIGPETIHNLTISKGSPDEYHERYVSALQKVEERRTKRESEIGAVERHIMLAQAKATSADEREINRISGTCQGYTNVGLPPAQAHFKSLVNQQLLERHNLIKPDDYVQMFRPTVPAPAMPSEPNYARETTASTRRRSGRESSAPSEVSEIVDYDVHLHSECSSQRSLITSTRKQKEWAMTENSMWKKHMSVDQRYEDRKTLAILESRSNFLRNPRYEPVTYGPIFMAKPRNVVFENYHIGQVYELSLELRNVSPCLQNLRLVPPKTGYFSMSLGQFPSEVSAVAAGLSCVYKLRFIPDSLADYDDSVILQTKAGDMVVPILARREPPKLTIPGTLDAGCCLVGGCRTVNFLVTNTGGRGTFCIMPRESWPATNFKSVIRPDGVDVSPFFVTPSVTELNKHQSTIIKVIFRPQAIKTYNRTLTVICDNCHIQHITLTGEGELANVEFVEVEGGLSDYKLGELPDISASKLIRFDSLHPFTFMQKRLQVRNTTRVALPYSWKIVKPQIQCPDEPMLIEDEEKMDVPEKLEELDLPNVRVLDSESVFTIEPEIGILKPDSLIEATLTFAPPIVGDFHRILHMVLHQIPETGDEDDDEMVRIRPNSARTDRSLIDLAGLEIELKGDSQPLRVAVEPYGIFVSGQLLVGSTIRKPILLTNHSLTPILYHWEPITSGPIIEVELPIGEIGLPTAAIQTTIKRFSTHLAMKNEIWTESEKRHIAVSAIHSTLIAPLMSEALFVSITGAEPGKIKETLKCYVENMEEPIYLFVEADIKGPEVLIEEPDLNFGLVRLGQIVSMNVTIQNLANMPAKWSMAESADSANQDNAMAESELKFIPSCGELKPLESRSVEVRFKPSKVRSVQTIVELFVEDGNESKLMVLAEVQTPKACLLSCHLILDDVYHGVEKMQTVKLYNQTLLHCSFSWLDVDGSQSSDCTLVMEPSFGYLGPREERDIMVKFTAHVLQEFSDVRIGCQVEGMEENIYLNVMADVKGLDVTYETLNADDSVRSDLTLDLGDVKLLEPASRTLVLRNVSAIACRFQFYVQRFPARPPTPPQILAAPVVKTGRKCLLNRRANLADPTSKTPAKALIELCQLMLRLEQGVAFGIEPSSGTLSAFGEQRITVTGYSDMWGTYTDTIVAELDSLAPVFIPVTLHAIGSPLSFQIASSNRKAPCLRFGTHVSGDKLTIRPVRINNSSPFDIRVDWEMYNVIPGDDKLVDLVVTYGQQFPLRDENGEEVIPTDETDASETSTQQPTVLDSPFTTPGLSVGSRTQTTMSDFTPPTRSYPKVIRLELRPHEGVRSSSPYSVTKSQVVIPAKRHSAVDFVFTPPIMTSLESEADCSSFALGHMSIEPQARASPGIIRVDGLNIQPLRVDMFAHIKPAKLIIEYDDKDDNGELVFRSALGDLMKDGQISRNSVRSAHCLLHNTTAAKLIFTLSTLPPFLLLNPPPPGGSHVKQTVHNITLKPKQTLAVNIGFCINVEILKIVDQQPEGEVVNDVKWTILRTGEKQIHYQSQFDIIFSNDTKQTVPMRATVAVPALTLSNDVVDFGTCFVDQERRKEITVSNLTSSQTYWRLEIVESGDKSNENAFVILPAEGFLDACVTHLSNNKCILHVTFTPRSSIVYENVYVLRGYLGEEERRLVIRGQGSFDGCHEIVFS